MVFSRKWKFIWFWMCPEVPRLLQTYWLHWWQREPQLKGTREWPLLEPPCSLKHTPRLPRGLHSPRKVAPLSQVKPESVLELPHSKEAVHPQVSLQKLPAPRREYCHIASLDFSMASNDKHLPTLDRAQTTCSFTVFICKNSLHFLKLGVEPCQDPAHSRYSINAYCTELKQIVSVSPAAVWTCGSWFLV